MHLARRLAVICFLALAASLGVVAAASAEQPGWLLPGKPGISGQAQVGATLTGEAGPYYCEPAVPCTGATAEWLSCTGSSSGGADRPRGAAHDPNQKAPGCVVRVPENAPSTYVVRSDDAGRYIQYHAIAHNIDCGEVQSNGTQECHPSSGHGYSPTIGPITGAAPAPAPAPAPIPVAALPLNTVPPTILGDAEDMQTLSVNPGTWTGTGPIAYKYQWLRCSTALKGCQAIEGAAATTYKVVRADLGARITATVTAVNAAGSRSYTTKLTDRVLAAKPRPGHDVLKISELLPVHRLVVKSVAGPRVVRSRSGVLLRVTVTDLRGFLIEGATVEASEESGAVVAVEKLSGARGIALLRVKLGSSATAPSRLVLTITASKPGEDSLTATKQVALRVLAV